MVKKVGLILLNFIFLTSTWASFSFCIWLILFIYTIFSGGCKNMVNGVCVVGNSDGAFLSSAFPLIFIANIPIMIFIYRKFLSKHKTFFYLISVPSLLLWSWVIISVFLDNISK